MKDAFKGLVLAFLIRGGCILPLVFSIAIHDTHPRMNAHWRETITISVVLIGMMLWLLHGIRRSDREYDQSKNEAQKLKIGDRLQWKYDSGTIVEKGRYHVIVTWDSGKHYPSHLNRVRLDQQK
jgi:4-amino-4-deoxy-L-arabinose transferase-like glycosyltransferase